MRFIEDKGIRDKYKGERIFVVGAGPSLDDFPDNFFDNKIMITVNYSYLAIPITEDTYISSLYTCTLDLVQKTEPELLARGLAFCPIDRVHDSRGASYNQIGRYGEIPIYARATISKQGKERFDESVRQIMNHQPALLKMRGTSAHPAIQAAVILGAKKVTLVGCDEHGLKFQFHWQRSRRGKKNPDIESLEANPPFYWQKKTVWTKWEEGRIWLSRAFKSYGIEVQKYYYKDTEYSKKGYEEIN